MTHLRISPTNLKPSQNLLATLQKSLALVAVALVLAVAVSAQEASTNPSSQDGGLLSMLFSGYGIAVLLVLALVGLIVAKKFRGKRAADWEDVEEEPKKIPSSQRNEGAPAPGNLMRRAEDHFVAQPRQTGEQRQSGASTTSESAFGAYRVDQEVWKLIFGKPHRMDVMASRAADDRRAIEASLVKALNSSETDEEGKRHAREALEEYGFLARQSSVLLMGRDAWERSSAARMLGEIGSPASLPFLIEALHDNDVVVRNQAVSSLGKLKVPAAIGSLLDIARRHPDIPAPLLSEALSACSVDTPGFLDLPQVEPGFPSESSPSEERGTINTFAAFDDLPEGTEDPALADALNQLGNDEGQLRAQAAHLLGSHPVQRSVLALTSLAMNDNDPAVRAAAVASLSTIDHESVFPPVLIALADESREVQAAAARALTSLRFDRGDAYVRVAETADSETLRSVARVCVKIGLVTQATGRLTSEDRRQAYEAFSLFSLLARANETDPIISVIENHPDENVRLTLVRVLNVAAQTELAPRLRELLTGEKISENVRTALLEVLYKLDQDSPAGGHVSSDNVTTDVA